MEQNPAPPRVTALNSQQPPGLLGFDSSQPRLSWQLDLPGGFPQEGYEVQVSPASDFSVGVVSTGMIRNDGQIGILAPGGPLESREVRFYRVRVVSGGKWSDWSESLRLEAGLLRADDWRAKAITLDGDTGSERKSPSPILRREFSLKEDAVKARLHITSLGIHLMEINGEPVSDELLAPGWTSYQTRLLSATHDVSRLIRRGPNVISSALGDGWYRGRLGWEPGEDRCRYGSEVALVAQLEVDLADGATLEVVTDETWLASTGQILAADLYDGSTIDLRLTKQGWDQPGYDDSDWSPAKVVPLDHSVIKPRMTAPVRVIAQWPAERLGSVDGEAIFDAGQNVAGFLRVAVTGEPGETVAVRHSEVLEPDGSLHTSSLRSARATDTYVLGGSIEQHELAPQFTFHGFRYAGIRTDAEIESAMSVAISSDLPRRSSFECSLPMLNKLHENVVWSQRDNFVSIPTDCPQRDERLGWTGDAQAFAATSCTLFDSEAFWANWLEDLSTDQHPKLGVSTVVPDVVLEGEPRFGRAGWADAATIVPWAVYESYGDPEILHRQFASMVAWVESMEARRGVGGIIGPEMQFGDWLDPDAPPERPWEAKTDSQFLANAFFSYSARLTADAARVVGAPNDHAMELTDLSREMASLTWAKWRGHVLETQTGCAIALRFGLVPEAERARVVAALAQMVREADGRISTGFLGTPHVLHALAEGRRLDEAYMMLLRQDHPSWLYQVTKGATTVWERWDAIMVDGSIHPGNMDPFGGDQEGEGGHMLSFNHYAYGAVVDWIYRYLAGIAPDPHAPGYRRVTLAPKPVNGVEWVNASVDSRYGTILSRWELRSPDEMVVEVSIPSGVSASFAPPAGPDTELTCDGTRVDDSAIDVASGSHRFTITRPHVSLGTGERG